VICHNPEAAERDQAVRERLVAHLQGLIGGSDAWPAGKRDELAGSLKNKPGLRRFLRRTKTGLLRTGHGAIAREAHLDGKWLLRTFDLTLTPGDLAAAYKQLIAVERGWRDMKGALALRPVFRYREDRIRAHIQLCWLALQFIVGTRLLGETWWDRFVASFDPGSRVWVDQSDPRAEERGHRRGLVGSKHAEHDICDVSEAGWAWSVAIDVGPVHLPGEEAGGASDPFVEQLDPGVASQLWERSRRTRTTPARSEIPGELKPTCGAHGSTWDCPRIGTATGTFSIKLSCAAVDGDLTSLHDAIAKLR